MPAHETADPSESDRFAYARPADWYGWQPDELGHSADISRILVRTDHVAIALAGAYVGSTGAMLFLHWTLRRGVLDDAAWSLLRDLAQADPNDTASGHDRLSVEVLLADGTRASTTASFQHDAAPEGPVLSTYFGTSTSGYRERIHGRTKLWLYPLPPEPSMDITVAWPAAEVPTTTTSVDTRAITGAAKRTTWIWPDDAGLDQASS